MKKPKITLEMLRRDIQAGLRAHAIRQRYKLTEKEFVKFLAQAGHRYVGHGRGQKGEIIPLTLIRPQDVKSPAEVLAERSVTAAMSAFLTELESRLHGSVESVLMTRNGIVWRAEIKYTKSVVHSATLEVGPP